MAEKPVKLTKTMATIIAARYFPRCKLKETKGRCGESKDEKVQRLENAVSELKDSIGSRIFCVWLVLIPVCFLMGFVLARLL